MWGFMGYKIALSGKGGVGKSTVAAVFAHLASQEGRRVLAVDADPDANLAAALGMSREDRRCLVPLSEHRALVEERTGAKVKQYGQVFKLNPDVSDIAEKESSEFRGIHLLVLGAVERGGSGCACPESTMLRALLVDVVLYKDDCVIIDFEAGLEHLGRATAQGVDVMAVVVEPGARAIETAAGVQRMAAEIGVKRVAIIGSKIASDQDEAFLRDAFPNGEYLGGVPYSETIRQADRDGVVLFDVLDDELRERFVRLWDGVKARIEE